MIKLRNIQNKKELAFNFLARAIFVLILVVTNQFCGKSSSNEKKSEDGISNRNKNDLIVTKDTDRSEDFFQNEFKKNSSLTAGKASKIILIGIDGADKDEIDTLFSLGKLPNLHRLVKNGVYGKLHSIQPLLSPLIWTSIATGKTPLKHGITDFLAVDKKSGKEIPVSSNLRKVKALWNVFSEHNKKAGVIGWLVTWPSEKINGYVVSDHVTYLDYNPHKNNIQNEDRICYPENLIDKIKPYFVSPNSVSLKEINNFVTINRNNFAGQKQDKNSILYNALSVISSTETIKNISAYLYRNLPVRQAGNKVDLLCVYFKGIDSFSHLFASSDFYRNKSAKLIEDPIAKFYMYQDKLLGNILNLTDESTTVIIVSDHGFKLNGTFSNKSSQIGKGNAVDWHRDNGIIIMSGNNIKKGKKINGANVLDIAPTILYLSNLPVASDMDGRVLTDAINASFLKEHSINKINSYENAEKGKQNNEPISSKKDEAIKNELKSLGYLNTGTANSYNNVGNLYMHQGKFKLAVKSFEKAVELAPKTAAFYDNLGSAYSASKMFAQAVGAHKKAISLNPNSAKAYNNLGKAYSDFGKYQPALHCYEKAVFLDPNFALAYNNIAELYYKQNKNDKALKFINDALKKDPNLSLAHYNFAVLLGEKENHSKAIDEFKKVLEIDPNFNLLSNVYNGLGVAYFNLKKYINALENFKQVKKINANFPEIHMRLGITYITLGMKDEGIKELKKELEAAPENKSLKDLINKLENDKEKK